MASLSDWIKDQTADYGQLKEAYPNAMKFGSALKKGISDLVPTQEDLNSPQKMGEWGLSAALNAPMGMMFVGPKSAGWDATKAQEAEKLLNAGAEPAQVWKEHLIGRMPDKSLFSEIDDSGAKFNLNNAHLDAYGAQEMPIYDAVSHKGLQTEYPDLSSLSALHFPSEQYKGASFDPKDKVITFGHEAMNQGKSVSLHELQHAIQRNEGWARGGNTENAQWDAIGDDVKAINKRLDQIVSIKDDLKNGMFAHGNDANKSKAKIEDLTDEYYNLMGMRSDLYNQNSPHDSYQRLTGEAQARATQDRMNMNMQQRRESYPLANDMLSDIPLGQLINRYR